MPAQDERSPLALVDPVLRLHPDRANAWLAEAARRAGVATLPPARIAAVVRDGARVQALRLEDGRAIAADLFVDAAGPDAPIAGQVAPGWEDWSDALPCDRLRVGAGTSRASAIDRYRAEPFGWRASWSGSEVLAGRGALPEGAGTEIRVRPGRRSAVWTGNLLALGDAAAQPGPLGCASFGLMLAQLALALELLPDARMEPVLVAEYCRRAALRADRLRDYLAAHYHVTGAHGSAAPASPALAETLAQFARRGRLPRFEEEAVGEDAWRMLLIGGGMRPQLVDPVAAAIPPDAARARVQQMARDLQTFVQRLPPA